MRVYCTYFERRRKKHKKSVCNSLEYKKRVFRLFRDKNESALHLSETEFKEIIDKNLVGKYLFGCIGVDNKFNFRSSTLQEIFFFSANVFLITCYAKCTIFTRVFKFFKIF